MLRLNVYDDCGLNQFVISENIDIAVIYVTFNYFAMIVDVFKSFFSDRPAFLPQLSSSCRATSTDIPDPLSPLLHFVHRLW